MNSINDVVLVYFEEEPAFYARIEDIQPDVKKDWWVLTLLVLSVPAQELSWILKEEYINGTVFTMGGNEVRIENVPPLNRNEPEKESAPKSGPEKTSKSKVISLFDRKK